MSWSEEDIQGIASRFAQLLEALPADLDEDGNAILGLALLARSRNARLLSQILEGSRNRAQMQKRIDAVVQAVVGKQYSLTQHGIVRTLSQRYTEAMLTRVGETLLQFHTELKANCGVESFITSGTLLGIVRDGRVIPHDDDFDLAYVSAFSTPSEILAERREIHLFLKDHPRFDAKTRPRKFTLQFREEGLRFYFDLFPAWIIEGRFSEVPLRPRALSGDDILPLGTVDFHGVPLPAPRNPEALLEVNYGPGWRTPDPSFRFDFNQYGKYYWFLQKDFRTWGTDG